MVSIVDANGEPMSSYSPTSIENLCLLYPTNNHSIDYKQKATHPN